MEKSHTKELMKIHKITIVVNFHSIKCHKILFIANKENMSAVVVAKCKEFINSVVVTKLVLKLSEIILKIN